MGCESVVQKAKDDFCRGDVRSAVSRLERYLERKSEKTWFSGNAWAYFYLAVYNRLQGNYNESQAIYSRLVNTPESDVYVRANSLIELAIIHKHLRQFDMVRPCYEKFHSLLDAESEPGENIARDKVMVHYHNSKSMFELLQGRVNIALLDLGESLNFIMAVHSVEDFSKPFITAYLNLYTCHMILGNHEQAREYLLLAHARMQSLDSPYAYGLVSFFETLAGHNLFAAGSPNDAIKALDNISEKVVNNFADFRKVFDFFSSIIVQLHEGKMDLQKIRESIREYGDDPLIKAYLPTLLTGSPPPGNDEGDDDIPAATLTN